MFAYCNSNPVIFVDISGYEPTYALDTDDDGIDDCFVYEYKYWKVRHARHRRYIERATGTVYIYTKITRDAFEKITYPKGFNSQTDLLVADFTNPDSPDASYLYAYQAQKVASKYQEKIIECLQKYDEDFNTSWDRSSRSLKKEWSAHDFFAPFDVSAQNVDFDNAEEGKGFVYYVKKAVMRGVKKLFGR